MKKIAIFAAFTLLSGIAHAQVQGPPDPQVVIYQQLLSEANARLVASAAHEQITAQELKQSQARVKELEDKYEPKKQPDK
jgi:hypothetical protein